MLCLQRGQKCEQSNNFWENYEEDIARVASLRSTVFRLSLGAAVFVRASGAVRTALLQCLPTSHRLLRVESKELCAQDPCVGCCLHRVACMVQSGTE